MPRDCYPTKVGAFAAAAINLVSTSTPQAHSATAKLPDGGGFDLRWRHLQSCRHEKRQRRSCHRHVPAEHPADTQWTSLDHRHSSGGHRSGFFVSGVELHQLDCGNCHDTQGDGFDCSSRQTNRVYACFDSRVVLRIRGI
jgi:hypothetical protein